MTFSSVESIVSWGLKVLSERSFIPAELNSWIFNKADKTKLPSINEKLDVLLKIFAGKSLKEERPDLWQNFQELKQIRNTFVHEGALALNGTEVNLQDTQKYIGYSKEIINFIESFLPKNMVRPLSTDRHDLEFFQKIQEPTTFGNEQSAIDLTNSPINSIPA